MPTISGRIVFDTSRSATVTSQSTGIANVPVVLQDIETGNRLVILTDDNGNYSFTRVKKGSYRIVEAYGTVGGIKTPGNFINAVPETIPIGADPPISYAKNAPKDSNHLESLTPNTLFVKVTTRNLSGQNFLDAPVIYTPIQGILDPCIKILPTNSIIAENETFDHLLHRTTVNPGEKKIFFQQTVSVEAWTNYLFSFWVLNVYRVAVGTEPQIGIVVFDQNGNVLCQKKLDCGISANTGVPEWKQLGTTINTASNTQITVKLSREDEQVSVNDYSINDYRINDIKLNEIVIPPPTIVEEISHRVITYGDKVTYTVTLTNPSNSPLKNVFFTDNIPEGLSFVPGSVTGGTDAANDNPNAGFNMPDIIGGDTAIVTFQVTLKNQPVSTTITNKAIINYAYTPVRGGILNNYSVQSNIVYTKVYTGADISLTKKVTPQVAVSWQQVIYSLDLYNAGPSPAENIHIIDEISSGILGPQYSLDGVNWQYWSGELDLHSLAVKAPLSVQIRGTVNPTHLGKISNTASVSSSTADPFIDNNTDTVDLLVLNKLLTVEKVADQKIVKNADDLSYCIKVKNIGSIDANNVTLVDDIPVGANFISGSLIVNGTSIPKDPSQGIELGTIRPGVSAEICYKVKISQGTCLKAIKNKADVSFMYYAAGNVPIDDSVASNVCITEIGTRSFKQLCKSETIKIPRQKPDVEILLNTVAEIEISSWLVIKTTAGVSKEGQILTGYKLLIEGKLIQKIEYIADEFDQSVHSVHSKDRFSTYIILHEKYIEGSDIVFNSHIEDIYSKKIDARSIFSNITFTISANYTYTV